MKITCFAVSAIGRATLGGLVIGFLTPLMAAPPTETGTVELAGMFGASLNLPNLTSSLQTALNQELGSGFTVTNGSDFKWFTGGSVGVAVAPTIMIVGETNYNYAGRSNVSYNSGGVSLALSEKLSLTDFTAGVHLQLPVPSRRVIPYVAAAVGVVRINASVSDSVVPTVGVSSTDLTYNLGGGVRIHVRQRWGFRPEVKWVRIPGQNYVRLGVGVFWQSRG
jgi:hypothetical protein